METKKQRFEEGTTKPLQYFNKGTEPNALPANVDVLVP